MDKSKPMTLSMVEEGEPKHMMDLMKATNPRITHSNASNNTTMEVTLLVSTNGLDGDDVVVVACSVVGSVVVVAWSVVVVAC